MNRYRSLVVAVVISLTGTAVAQEPTDTGEPSTDAGQAPKVPKRGDFDAGGQIRLPNGPDAMNQYATYNWIAVDLKGRYYLLDSVTVDAIAPVAIHHPDTLMTGEDPKMFGGLEARFEAKLPKTQIGIALTGAYMHDGAMLLSDKDYPLFVGNFEPGFSTGPIAKLKLSSVVDFSLAPLFVYQSSSAGALEAVQLPTSLIVRLGSVVQASADVGIYTGKDFSFGGDGGGRIATGGSLQVKIGPILAHAGAGFASLLTGGLYPTIGDSLYLDLSVKYAK